MTAAIRAMYSLAGIADGGIHAIRDGLRTIGADVGDVAFDPDEEMLTVAAANEASARQIAAFMSGMLRTQRLIARKMIRQSTGTGVAQGCTDGELAASPDIQLIGEGLTGLRGSLLALFRFFERSFRDMAAAFDAQDNHYPTMIPNAVLAEMGYFAHFPQHVTFCCHFRGSLPVLEAVAADAGASSDGAARDQRFAHGLAPPDHVLAPGVCLPCYAQQRGMVLAPGEIRTLTMQNHVFRYEANNFRPLARGWDFSVRDIVFFGSNANLVARRAAVMEATFAFCESLGLDVAIELANDPFFLDASRDKAIYQRMGEVKYELLFDMPGRAEPLAAASFNLHRDFYTRLYDIRRAEGDVAESACMGFGIDRWLYGFVRQKGLDPARWPACVTDAL